MKRSSLLIAVLIFCVTAIVIGQERQGGGVYKRAASTMDSSPKTFDTKDYKAAIAAIRASAIAGAAKP